MRPLDRLRDLLIRLRSLSPATRAAVAVFLAALAMRLVWVAFFESPYDNLYSDMAGYIDRALFTAYGEGDTSKILFTLYPPGTHLVYAAEMRLVGWSHHAPMLLLHCAWGAAVAPCATLLALRVVPRLGVAVGVGLFAAAWYPLLAFAGFFSSEEPYAGALALSAWLLVRLLETGKGAVALGVAAGVAYLVRPQIVLTLAALALVGLYALLRPRRWRGPKVPLGPLLVAGGILTAAVAFGALRYHAITGRWGIVSDNSAMTRLWADTDYGRIDTRDQKFTFTSPPKKETGEDRMLVVDGYIGDPVQLERARREAVATMTTGERVVRWLRNVRLLFVHSSMWPDAWRQTRSWRKTWYGETHLLLLFTIGPLALVGLGATVRRPRTALVVSAAHVVTMLVVAAFFFGEQRYRVPYDPFLFLLALEGARALGLLRLLRLEPEAGVEAPSPAVAPSPPAERAPAPRQPAPTPGRRKRRRGRR